MMLTIIIDKDRNMLAKCIAKLTDNQFIAYQCFVNCPMQGIELAKQAHVSLAVVALDCADYDGIDIALQLIAINPNIKILGTADDVRDISKFNLLGGNLVGVVDKKSQEEQILLGLDNALNAIKAGDSRIYYKSIDGFDMFLDDVAVDFNCAKAKELLALLVYKHGACIEMGSAIAYLWPDRDIDSSKRLYRNAVWRLRNTLDKHGIKDSVIFQRARLKLNCANAKCDYWDIIDGKRRYSTGLFMPSYEWGGEVQLQIDAGIEYL